MQAITVCSCRRCIFELPISCRQLQFFCCRHCIFELPTLCRQLQFCCCRRCIVELPISCRQLQFFLLSSLFFSMGKFKGYFSIFSGNKFVIFFDSEDECQEGFLKSNHLNMYCTCNRLTVLL